jgi:hypothetical protein
VAAVANQIPATWDIDGDVDGFVDNNMFYYSGITRRLG